MPETHFRFPEDRGDFSRTVLRCVGECRKQSGTMCPSYTPPFVDLAAAADTLIAAEAMAAPG